MIKTTDMFRNLKFCIVIYFFGYFLGINRTENFVSLQDDVIIDIKVGEFSNGGTNKVFCDKTNSNNEKRNCNYIS